MGAFPVFFPRFSGVFLWLSDAFSNDFPMSDLAAWGVTFKNMLSDGHTIKEQDIHQFGLLLYLNSKISLGEHSIMLHNFSTVKRVMFLPFFKLSKVLLSMPDFSRKY